MIISNSRKFIFVHLMKCAGTSVKSALLPHLTVNDIVLFRGLDGGWHQGLKAIGGPTKHSSAERIRAFVGNRFWDECYNFAVVRPPFERMLSYYKFLLRGQSRRPLTEDEMAAYRATGNLPQRRSYTSRAARAAFEADDFSGFVEWLLCVPNHPLPPQASELSDADGTLLVGDIVRMDRLETDWSRVQKRLGVEAPLNQKNPSHLDGDVSLSDEARHLLAKAYARDYELFGFKPGS